MKNEEWRKQLTDSVTTQRELRRHVTKTFLVPAATTSQPIWAEIRTTLDDDPPIGRFATDVVMVGVHRINDPESMPPEMMTEKIVEAFLRVKRSVRLWETGTRDAFPTATELELLDQHKIVT